MRPEMKFQPNIKKMLFILLFTVGEIKWNLVSGVVQENGPFHKVNHFCFDEMNACADVSFRIISFRIVSTWHFIIQNKTSFLSKSFILGAAKMRNCEQLWEIDQARKWKYPILLEIKFLVNEKRESHIKQETWIDRTRTSDKDPPHRKYLWVDKKFFFLWR